MTNEEIVDAYAAAFEAADPDAVRQLIAPGAVIWHNFDDRERDIADSLHELSRMREHLEGARFDIVERFAVADGIGIRQVMRATRRGSGARFASHQVVFFRIRDGKIVRIEEYVAPAAVG